MTAVPQLRTPGVIAEEIGVPLSRVLHVLREHAHEIRPIGRAGTIRLYSADAIVRVRQVLSRTTTHTNTTR